MALTKVTNSLLSTPPTDFDDGGLQDDIALLAFKTQSNGSLAKYNLVDQVVDSFEDATGIDASTSTDENRDSTGKYFYGGAAGNATGGTITSNGTKKVHTFNTAENGSATNNFVAPSAHSAIEWLLVAGGGQGGASNGGSGGGGAGGFRTGTGFSVAAGTFAVVAGAGGSTGTSTGADGANSTFSTLSATGGGGGVTPNDNGRTGGSGGGGSYDGTGGAGNAGSYTPVEGYAGGQGGQYSGGGGGGASEVGESCGGSYGHEFGGDGGDGPASTITGSSVTYAGGGGGGLHSNGTQGAGDGGAGGGGAGGFNAAGTNGTNGLGGGGGGSSDTNVAGIGGNGVVILSYEQNTFVAEGGDMSLVSVANTAEAVPTKGDMVMTITNGAGTTTLNTDIKAFVSRDNGTTYTQGTLASQGTSGGHTVVTFHDLDISGQPSGSSMRWKVTTHNQDANKTTRLQAVSLGWS